MRVALVAATRCVTTMGHKKRRSPNESRITAHGLEEGVDLEEALGTPTALVTVMAMARRMVEKAARIWKEGDGGSREGREGGEFKARARWPRYLE